MPNSSAMGTAVDIVVTALYLRGAPRPLDLPRRGWPELVAAMRREKAGISESARVFQSIGATLPATILDTPGLLDWAQQACEEDAVLTIDSEAYPSRWLEVFGDLAPPALWRSGAIPKTSWVGAVGSREISSEIVDYMAGVGRTVAALEYGLVSGGAIGCDSAAERAAMEAGAPVLRLLPHGLQLRTDFDAAIRLSLAAPNEPFSRTLAMERNALIYAAAVATVVGHARMRKGGTWHGASEALRRRLGRLLVRPEDSPAFRALISLGAGVLKDPADLGFALASAPPQKPLFAYEKRR